MSTADGLAFDDEAVDAARELALNQLTYCDRTRAELEQHLLKKKIEPELITHVLDRLAAAGLIDDRRFADTWVASRHAARGLSRRAVADELRRKGVDDDLAAAALASVDADAERAAALELVKAKLRRVDVAELDDGERRRIQHRLASMLARKGYGPDLVFDIVREATEK